MPSDYLPPISLEIKQGLTPYEALIHRKKVAAKNLRDAAVMSDAPLIGMMGK